MRNQLIYKNRIQGFQDVRETVKTVEKIAASNTHFLKIKVNNLKLYTAEIEKILAELAGSYSACKHPLLKNNPQGQKMILIIGADKGLAGGLYHNLINFFLPKADGYSKIYIIGAKASRFLQDEGIKAENLPLDFLEIPSAEEISKTTEHIFSEFTERGLSQFDIIYPEFIFLTEQRPKIINFLPFKFEVGAKDGNAISGASSFGLPIFEPSRKKFFENILQKYIETFFYKIIMEAKLSEIAARTVAMEHAAETTKRFIHQLKIDYFKERRRSATQKQLESFVVHKLARV